MSVLIRNRRELNGNETTIAPAVAAEATSESVAGRARSYAEARRLRIRRRRLVALAASAPVWAVSAVPLAREIGPDGGAGVAVYLSVAAASLAVAALLRAAYVLLVRRRQRFWSPWIFLTAAALVLAGYAVQTAGEKEAPLAAAFSQSSQPR